MGLNRREKSRLERSGSVDLRIPNVQASNGRSIPILGIGMDQITDEHQAYEAVRYALRIGYRSIDTASSYDNESAVGRAVKDSGLPREDLYITTKVKALDQGYDATLRAFDRSLAAVGTDYVDAYLIHWPGKYMFVQTWKALLKVYDEGRVRVIGVANFNPHHIERLRDETGVLPMVDQIEWHPYFQQADVAAYCTQHSIVIEGWSPLMCGGVVLEDPAITQIAASVGKTPAQVILRWHIQEGRRIFPRSVTPSRIAENFDLFDFSLSDADMAVIDGLGSREVRIGPDPDIFFMR